MWWICLLSAHNCKTLFPSVIPELPTAVLTDASLSGGGRLWATDWMYANWALDYLSVYYLHINCKETFTTVLAAHRWAPFWSGHRVIIKTDSQVAAAILNKGSTCCPVIMDWIRSLFWLKEYCNFSLLVKHIPGTTKTLPGSNDFESYLPPLSLALLKSKGSAATWQWSHQFPAPSICTYYQVHLRESKAFMPVLLCILRLPASPSRSINP